MTEARFDVARFDVVGIGSAIVDIIATIDDAFIAAEGLTKGTMALIDAERAKTLYSRMGHAIEMSGGSAANTMVGIASLGGAPAFIGKVGGDTLGEIFSHELEVAGVTFHGGAKGSTTLPTAISMILVTPDAQRTMNTFLGACTELAPADIDENVIAAAQVVYVEGYQWDTPLAKEAIRKACGAAKAAGRQVSLSLADPFVVDRHGAELKALIKTDVDILFGNQDEIFHLTGAKTLDDAVAALRDAKVLTVMTLGAKGAVVVDGDTITTADAVPVTKVVDTTGAGDLFAAGFLYGYTHGRDSASCARIGALAAAEVIGHLGARPEVALRDLLKKHGL